MNQKRNVVSLLFCLAMLASTSSTAAAQGVKVYDVGGSALIEHGDTLKMPLSREEKRGIKALLDSARIRTQTAAPAMTDTLTVVVRADSAFH